MPINGQLSTSADDDRFAVALDSGGTITVTFDSPTNSTWANYFQIAIYDQSDTLVGYRSTGSDAAFDTDVTSAGTYYVSIIAGDYYFNGGEYKLTVDAQLDHPIPDAAIIGSPVGEQLTGTTGDDLIYGLGGNDRIDGGTGTDTVVFRSATAHLSINTVAGLTAVRGDYAAGEHAYSISRLWNVEKLQTDDGTQTITAAPVSPTLGTAQNDVLKGTAADDILDGLGGSDYIDGGAGNDTMVLFGAKESFTTLSVGGITRIVGSADSYEYAGHTVKTTHVETLGFNQNQTKALVITDDTVVFGTSGANQLVGSSGNEVFDGQGGKDTIDGGAGTDTVVFFDRADNFTITFPTGATSVVTVLGKAGSEYAGQTVVASNVESLAFADRTVLVTNPPSLVLTPSTTILAEGGSGATLEVALSVAPTDAVTLNFSGGSQLSPSASSLTFDATNWATPQSVTITAVDDTVYESAHSGSLTVSVQTTDMLYEDLGSSTLSYTISDNDNATPTTGEVSGKLWNDFDKDRSYDPGEAWLSGWTVFDDANKNGTLDSGEARTTSDATGNYLLGNLTPGTHTIVAVTRSGWLPTYPGTGSASATIITNMGTSGKVSVETLTETVVSSEVAQATYTNLGTATNIAAFHADPRFANVDGQGYSVVVIDTGIDPDHPYFGPDNDNNLVADRIVYQEDFFGKGDSIASDGFGHGTHVAGIIGSSNSTYPGVAPGVNLIVLKVFPDVDDSASGYDINHDIEEALSWVVTNAEKFNVVAVNMSIGDFTFRTTATTGYGSSYFQTLAQNGIVVVSASGNGYADEYDNDPETMGKAEQGVSYPSSDPYSLSVGAVWAGSDTYGSLQTGTTDALAVFSQRDDELSDIFAPGVFIDSAWNGATHVLKSGTSMASPEIAGMVALAQQLAEQELGRRLSFDEIRSLLKSTGDPIVDGDDENDVVPNTGLTFYRVDMLALAEAILEMKPSASHTVIITAGNTTTGKDFGFGATTSVQALSGDDMVFGTMYGETLRGGAGDDQIQGGTGDDELHGEAGNDILDGGQGTDQAVYVGNRSNYTVVPTLKGYAVTDNIGTDGSDTLANVEALVFADTTVMPSGKTVDFLAYSWKDHTLLDGVSITAGTTAATQTTGTDGSTSFTGITDASLALSAERAVPTTETSLTDEAVNLQDAIAILKMIVGLDVNGAGKALSPYQALAADYDGNGEVQLTDAIGVLKHVVSLTAPEPAWHFASETDTSIPQVAALSPGVAPTISADLSIAASPVHVGLVAYLSGDVDGSFTGAIDSQDLDDTQPGYFTTLTQDHGLNLAQFGVYS